MPIGGTSPHSYLWSNGQTTSSAVKMTAGIYIVTLTDINSCVTTTTVTVTQPAAIALTNFVSTATYCRDSKDGSLEIITVTGGIAPYTYQWSSGTVKYETYIIGLKGDDYFVTITDANMCKYFDTLTVESPDIECLEIPTCFTPNVDGKNDRWAIKGIDIYPDATIEIYNRWGVLIFKTDANYYNEPWDGTFKGKEVPVGSYIYIINLHNDWEPKSGVVTIIR